ncbi:MAG: glycosyltransferase family 4 protein [Proteobacteria bacterium]|nr:glycosyltransferase family 4 protein [Pseudomonadota bacterium]
MKYLIVHQYFYPDLSAVSQVISQVAFSIAAKGDKVTVLCSRNRYDGKVGSSLPPKEWVQGVEIQRCWGPNFGKRSFFGRVLDLASFCFIALGKLLFFPRVDTAVFLTNPPFFSILGTWLKKKRKERFIYVLMDVYPDIAIQGEVIREKGWIAHVLQRMARFTLKNADAVVVLGEDMKEVAVRQGAPADKVAIIRNWADPEKIFPVSPENNELRKKWGLEGKFVVAYSGNFGVSHDFEDLLHTAKDLASNDEIRFLLIGDGVRRREVEKFVNSRRLPNVILQPYQDASSLSESLSVGDIHYISLRRGFEGLVVPSKAYGAMAAGRPIVYQGAATGEIARMIDKEGIGYIVSPGDRKGLNNRILDLRMNPELRKCLGETARKALEERYSAAIGLGLYRKVLAGET